MKNEGHLFCFYGYFCFPFATSPSIFFFQFVSDIRGSWCFIFILAAHAGQNPGFLLKGCSLNVVKIFLKGNKYRKVNSDSTFHLHPFSLY